MAIIGCVTRIVATSDWLLVLTLCILIVVCVLLCHYTALFGPHSPLGSLLDVAYGIRRHQHYCYCVVNLVTWRRTHLPSDVAVAYLAVGRMTLCVVVYSSCGWRCIGDDPTHLLMTVVVWRIVVPGEVVWRWPFYLCQYWLAWSDGITYPQLTHGPIVYCVTVTATSDPSTCDWLAGPVFCDGYPHDDITHSDDVTLLTLNSVRRDVYCSRALQRRYYRGIMIYRIIKPTTFTTTTLWLAGYLPQPTQWLSLYVSIDDWYWYCVVLLWLIGQTLWLMVLYSDVVLCVVIVLCIVILCIVSILISNLFDPIERDIIDCVIVLMTLWFVPG